MLKRTLIVLSLTFVLVASALPLPNVAGMLMTPDEVASLEATPQDAAENRAKGSNTFVRVLKFPIKSIGRLFGIGNKDGNKPQRLSRKDVEKFESVGSSKVIDARTTEPAAASADVPGLNPALATAQQNLERGRASLNSGNINDAIAALSTAATSDPKLHEAHSLLGVAYEAKGMRDRAFKSLEAAIKLDENNAEYANNLGYLHYKNGAYDKAAKYLKRATKSAPQVQRYWNNLGLAQAQRAKFDEAYECFVRAVGEYEGHMNVANRAQSMAYDKAAIKHLEAARALRPTAEILLRLVVLYKRNHQDLLAAEANTALVAARSTASAK
jgi:Tfp pilus assembly protein PilF